MTRRGAEQPAWVEMRREVQRRAASIPAWAPRLDPRTLQRPDGKVVTLFYYYTPKNIYRRIIATIWDPGTTEE